MKRQVITEWKNLLDKKADQPLIRYALTGDGSNSATADVDGRPGWAWVRYDEKSDRASQVMNYRYPGISQDVPVVVGRQYPTDRFYQILGLNIELYAQSMSGGGYSSYLLAPHGSTHTAGTGTDPAPIVTGNIAHGRARATEPVSMSVFVEALYYEYNSEITFWPGGTITMTGHTPPDADTHRYVLISINGATNLLVASDGDPSPSPLSPTLPVVPIGAIPICAVMLENGATSITYDEIYDYRLLFAVAGSVAQQINELLAIAEDDWDYEFSKHVVEGN